MSRQAVTAIGVATAGPYSHAVGDGNLMFFSGQTPVEPNSGKLVAGTIGDQTRQCFANLFAVMNVAGLTEKDVVSVQVYLTDMNDIGAMNDVYVEYFSEPYPSRTTIGVASLPLHANIEIGMIAKARS